MASKVKYPGDSQSLCQHPRLGNMLCILELSYHGEHFFDIIVLGYVDHLLSDSRVGLVLTSSKRSYATHPASQVCGNCPFWQPLLTLVPEGNIQALKGRSNSVSVGSLGPIVHRVLFESSKHL